MQTRRVGLAGLGLIGGSLGLALVGSGLFQEVLGHDAAEGIGQAALAAGAITKAVPALTDLADAQVIIIATPVRAVVPTAASLFSVVRPGTIITDTASTKGEILSSIIPLIPEGVHFIGGHPMAGSERAGLAAADAYLFENAAYVLTTMPPVPALARDELRSVLSCTGARFLYLSPEEHDLIAAGISHLPHLLAATLVNTAASLERNQPGALALAGGGFRDTTRIAGGDAALWAEILSTNRGPLGTVLDLFRTELRRIEEILVSGGEGELASILAAARGTRDEIPARGKGLIGKVEEIVVAMQDRPGAIKQVLDVLAAERINVKDIEILRLREGEGGTLRLGVEDESMSVRAVELLGVAGLRARRR